MSSVVQKNVFGFEVAVNDVEAVKTLEGAKEFGRVETRPVDIKTLILLKMVKKLSAVNKCKHKVELLR